MRTTKELLIAGVGKKRFLAISPEFRWSHLVRLKVLFFFIRARLLIILDFKRALIEVGGLGVVTQFISAAIVD